MADNELLPYVEAVLDKEHPREWNWALMDYGAHLKKTGFRYTSKSLHYTKQSKFIGSSRQLRGQIIRYLLEHKSVPYDTMVTKFNFPKEEVITQVRALQREGFLTIDNNIIHLTTS